MVDVDEFRPARAFECDICHEKIEWESGLCSECHEEMRDFFTQPPDTQESSGVGHSEA